MNTASSDKLAYALNALAALDRDALAKRWTEVFGCPVPRGIHASFLLRALAWRCQMAAQAKGDANGSGSMLKKLRRSAASAANTTLAPGTRLLREWQGQTHHVTVLANGFEYAGRNWRSLTAITRHITGTPWSGPRFFGLRP